MRRWRALRKAARHAPNADFALVTLGSLLKDQGMVDEAVAVYRRAARVANEPPATAQNNMIIAICAVTSATGTDWTKPKRGAIGGGASERASASQPFAALSMACSPGDHLALARNWAKGFAVAEAAVPKAPARVPARRDAGSIRLGFLSSDFFQHATASLLAELIERFDHARFAPFAYCLSADDGSAMRRRLMSASTASP